MQRILEKERLRHRITINLNDAQYGIVMDEAEQQGLAPSIICRKAFAEGLPALRRRALASRWKSKRKRRKEDEHE